MTVGAPTHDARGSVQDDALGPWRMVLQTGPALGLLDPADDLNHGRRDILNHGRPDVCNFVANHFMHSQGGPSR